MQLCKKYATKPMEKKLKALHNARSVQKTNRALTPKPNSVRRNALKFLCRPETPLT